MIILMKFCTLEMATPEKTNSSNPGPKTWVKFDEDAPENNLQASQESCTAIIKAESAQIDFDESKSVKSESSKVAEDKAAAVITPESVHINVGRPSVNRSVQLDSQNNSSAGNKIPDPKSTLKSVDLRENLNGRSNSLANSGLGNVGNAVIRQGFGELT